MTTYKSIKYNISGADLTGLTASQIPNLDVTTERAGFELVYYNSTQGWLLKDK